VLVQGVTRDNNALGYFGYAYYDENKGKLKAVPVVNPKGKAVLPSMENVMAGSYEPLARPIFIYVSEKAMDAPEVKEFVEFYLKHGGKLAKEVKYVPLPEKPTTSNPGKPQQEEDRAPASAAPPKSASRSTTC
jgi:phosphate transport system substrate-binding protein